MIRLIHTSDIHLDACFVSSGFPATEGNRRRQGLRDALHRILRRAVEWPADAVLIAGDLFDLDRLSRGTVGFLRTEFERAGNIPIYIAPGNCDPYVSHSPYATESWPGNVTIFTESSWVEQELRSVPLTIHGFGFTDAELGRLPLDALEAPVDERYHVAVAHGSELGSSQPTTPVPAGKSLCGSFLAEKAMRPNLAYIALGHYHAMQRVGDESGTTVWYSGSPEGLGFDDLGEHGYLEIELDGDEKRVRPVILPHVEYVSHQIDCSTFTSIDDISQAIRALVRTQEFTRLARVTLTGRGLPEWRYEIDAVRTKLAPEFSFLTIVDATKPHEDYEALGRECTSLGGFIAQMNAELMDASDLELRRLLERAREVGLAAYRAAPVPIAGTDRG